MTRDENAGVVRRRTRILTVLAMVGVFTSGLAACVNAADAAMQMACCKAGHDHCPMKDSASNCCKLSGQTESQATIVKATPISAPASFVLTPAILPVVAAADGHHRRPNDSSPPGLFDGPPPYIAFSAL